MELLSQTGVPNSPVSVPAVKYPSQIQSVSKSGVVKKYDHYRFQWSTMRVILLPHELRLYLDVNDSVPNCVLPLCDFVVFAVDERAVGMRNAFYIVTPGESFLFATETSTEQQEWIDVLSPHSRPSLSTILPSPSTPSNINKNQITYNPTPPTPPLTRSNSYASGTFKSLTPSNSYIKSRISSPNHHMGLMVVPGGHISPHLNIISPQVASNTTPVKIAVVSHQKSSVPNLSSAAEDISQKLGDSLSPIKANELPKQKNTHNRASGDVIIAEEQKMHFIDASVGTEDHVWCDVNDALLKLENEVQEYQVKRDTTISRLQHENICLNRELHILNAKYATDLKTSNQKVETAQEETYLLRTKLQDLQECVTQLQQNQTGPLIERTPTEIDYAELESRLQRAYDEIKELKMKLDESCDILSISRNDISVSSVDGDNGHEHLSVHNSSVQKKGRRRSIDFAVTTAVLAHQEKLSKDVFQLLKSLESKQSKSDEAQTQLRIFHKTIDSSFAIIIEDVKELEQKYATSSFELQKKTTEIQRLQERQSKLENEFKIMMKACRSLKDEKQQWDAEKLHLQTLMLSSKSDTSISRSLNEYERIAKPR